MAMESARETLIVLSYFYISGFCFWGIHTSQYKSVYNVYLQYIHLHCIPSLFPCELHLSLAKALPRRAQRIAGHGGDDQSQSRPQAEHWRGSLEKKWRLCGYATYNCRGLRVGISPTKHGNILKAHLW